MRTKIGFGGGERCVKWLVAVSIYENAKKVAFRVIGGGAGSTEKCDILPFPRRGSFRAPWRAALLGWLDVF